jgi:hypothetical protein
MIGSPNGLFSFSTVTDFSNAFIYCRLLRTSTMAIRNASCTGTGMAMQ